MTKPIILTGIRSNEEPTIANYIGAFLPMIQMQKKYAGEYQLNMFVPDLHSFTTTINHDELYANTLKNLKYFIAAGLDIDDTNTYIYRQSYVPAHSELAWILDCFTGFGEMSRMTQFKDKSASEQSISVGLFNYPVLMAADILIYGAQYIPVGEDQFQHLEFTRDIAERMNNRFGELFVIPEPNDKQTQFIERDKGLRIRSLTEPEKKMSKSSTDEKSKILLADTPEVAYKKIMSATTDSCANIQFDFEKQPGISSLLQLLAYTSGRPQSDINAEWAGRDRYGDFKKAVAESVAAFLTDFHARFDGIDDATLERKLQKSEAEMNVRANEQLYKVQQAVGVRPKGGV